MCTFRTIGSWLEGYIALKTDTMAKDTIQEAFYDTLTYNSDVLVLSDCKNFMM